MGHDDLILRNLERDQMLGEVKSRSDRGVFPTSPQTVWQLTGTPRMCESWSALVCRRQFPAFVTKTTGTANCPWESTNFSNALFAAGIGILPRTSTPSMSNSSPKRGCGCRRERWTSRFVGQLITKRKKGGKKKKKRSSTVGIKEGDRHALEFNWGEALWKTY